MRATIWGWGGQEASGGAEQALEGLTLMPQKQGRGGLCRQWLGPGTQAEGLRGPGREPRLTQEPPGLGADGRSQCHL